MITYDFEVVGGQFDGAPALAWRDDGRHPPPPVILVGVCGVGVHCGTGKCRRREAHVSYWLPDEEDVPTGAQAYRKQEESIDRREGDELAGRVVYAVGGLLDPSNFVAKARVPMRRSDPLVTAHAPARCTLTPVHGGYPGVRS